MQKRTIGDLAILGGKAMFEEDVHVGRPNIGDKDRLLQRFHEILDRNWLTNRGPFVQQFEEELARLMGVEHCIAMCNGTVALEIAIRACDLSGEVIVPSFTFVATAHALQWQKIKPVFCDVDPITHTLDPARVEELITPKTTGILGVHLWGRPCEIDALSKVASDHGLRLLFDAAHALGCTYKGRSIGNFGNLEVFSFHATKFVNSFEGGAVTTNDGGLAEKLRLMKNFGFKGYDNVIHLGTNGKMSEISAAMGLTSLESMDEFAAVNKRNYVRYLGALEPEPALTPVKYPSDESCNYQYVVFEVDEEQAGISRDRLVEVLHREKILARSYFKPGCHRMEPYRSDFPDVHLPVTERLAERVLVLPTGTGVSSDDIDSICDVIRFILANGKKVDKGLDARP